MKRVGLMILGMIMFVSSAIAAEEKPSLAVLDFTNITSAYWWKPGVGRELSNMLTNELSSSKKFSVLERRKLDAVISELKLSQSGLVSPASKRQIGKLKGAQYLVTATVTSFEEGTEGAGTGFNFMGIGVGQKSQKTSLSVDLRVIETETGEIVDTRTIEATSENSSMGFSGNFMGIGVAKEETKKTPATKAIRGTVVRIADYLVCSMVEKTQECMSKFEASEERRKAKTRDSIALDE